jgi:hypothetical protein
LTPISTIYNILFRAKPPQPLNKNLVIIKYNTLTSIFLALCFFYEVFSTNIMIFGSLIIIN